MSEQEKKKGLYTRAKGLGRKIIGKVSPKSKKSTARRGKKSAPRAKSSIKSKSSAIIRQKKSAIRPFSTREAANLPPAPIPGIKTKQRAKPLPPVPKRSPPSNKLPRKTDNDEMPRPSSKLPQKTDNDEMPKPKREQGVVDLKSQRKKISAKSENKPRSKTANKKVSAVEEQLKSKKPAASRTTVRKTSVGKTKTRKTRVSYD